MSESENKAAGLYHENLYTQIGNKHLTHITIKVTISYTALIGKVLCSIKIKLYI